MVAKDFAKYIMQPEVNNEFTKGGLGRYMPVYAQSVKNDPWWTKSGPPNLLPHILPMVEQGFNRPTQAEWHFYTPAWADVENNHVFQRALVDVAKGQATVKEALNKAFVEAEQIFAKYPIEQA